MAETAHPEHRSRPPLVALLSYPVRESHEVLHPSTRRKRLNLIGSSDEQRMLAKVE